MFFSHMLNVGLMKKEVLSNSIFPSKDNAERVLIDHFVKDVRCKKNPFCD